MFGLSISAKSQSWPGVEYSYVRVGNYNLQSDLVGVSDAQPIKNGELDSTVLHFAPLLSDSLVESLLSIVNKKDQLLLEGLSKCYIPHHCFVFYDDNHKPVASIALCFMCQRIDLYPKIDYESPSNISKKQVELAEDDLMSLISVMEQAEDAYYHEIALYKDLEKYKSYDKAMRDVPGIIPGGFVDDFSGYNLIEFKDHNDLNVVDRLLENEEISAGGASYFFADLSFEDQMDEIHFYSEYSFDEAEPKEFILMDSTLELGLPVKIGMTIEEVNRILIEKSGLDVFSGLFYTQSKHPYLYIVDQDQSYFEMKFYFENSVLTKIERL